MRIWSLTCGAALAVALGGCASKQQSAEPPARGITATAQPAPQPRTSAMCPMMIDPATTQVSTSDTSDGVAIAFTTTSDVDEVRARVHHMADMHNQITGMRTPEKDTGMQHGAMPGGREGGIGTEGATSQSEEIPSHEHMPGMQMVPASATAEDIPGGARVVLVPADPVQLTALREDARLRADMMRKGQCPMRTAS